MNYSTEFPLLRGQVLAQEWQTPTDLVACYRLVDDDGTADLIYQCCAQCSSQSEWSELGWW